MDIKKIVVLFLLSSRTGCDLLHSPQKDYNTYESQTKSLEEEIKRHKSYVRKNIKLPDMLYKTRKEIIGYLKTYYQISEEEYSHLSRDYKRLLYMHEYRTGHKNEKK